MREVVFGIMAIVLLGYLLFFISPMMITMKDFTIQTVNMTDPTIEIYFEMGDGLYAVLGLVGFGVIAFMIFAYATRQEIT